MRCYQISTFKKLLIHCMNTNNQTTADSHTKCPIRYEFLISCSLSLHLGVTHHNKSRLVSDRLLGDIGQNSL